MSEIKKMNKKVVTAIIVVAAISFTVLCLIGFKFSKKKKGGFGGRGGFGGGATVTTVRTIDAVPSTLKDYVFTNGEIQTQTAIEVFPAIGGTVVEMKVSLGSPVKKGDVIAYVDPSDAGSYYVKSPVVAPIDGSIISRASLSNLSIMEETLGEKPFIGQKIYVSKRNMIMPKIEKAKNENGDWI